MKNKAYCIIKAERAEAKGDLHSAINWYREAARECLKAARECRLMEKTMACIGM